MSKQMLTILNFKRIFILQLKLNSVFIPICKIFKKKNPTVIIYNVIMK
jgi:hypothetical protein